MDYVPAAAAMRRAWHYAYNLYSSATSEQQPIRPQPLDWAEHLPPRLRYEQMRELKGTFEQNYPGELLDEDCLPGTRYWSSVHDQLRPGNRLRWIPWTLVLSERQESDIQAAKARRAPRSELQLLAQVCWDDPPQLSEDDLRPSPWRLSRMLQVRRNAYALSGGCHLANHKILDQKMLAAFTKAYSAESGLRAPSLKEYMEADRVIMKECYKLVNTQSWSLDDAFHELSTVRQDVSSYMQPRPRPLPAPANDQGETKSSPDSSSKGVGKKGPSVTSPPKEGKKGSAKAERSRTGPRRPDGWHRDWHLFTDIGGVRTPICMRFKISDCSTPVCRYAHRCPIPLANGQPCNGEHRAVDCKSRQSSGRRVRT